MGNWRRIRAVGCLVVLVLLIGCGKSPTAPAPVPQLSVSFTFHESDPYAGYPWYIGIPASVHFEAIIEDWTDHYPMFCQIRTVIAGRDSTVVFDGFFYQATVSKTLFFRDVEPEDICLSYYVELWKDSPDGATSIQVISGTYQP